MLKQALVCCLFLAACGESVSPGIHLTAADPEHGIRGDVTDEDGGVIRFESRVVDGTARAEVTNRDGVVIARYEEHDVDRTKIEIAGVPYRFAGDQPFEDALAQLATDGPLIRLLAYDLVTLVSAPGLVRERRGLEVPFQAAQRHIGVLAARGANNGDYFSDADRYVVKNVDPRIILDENWNVNGAVPEGERRPDDDSRVGDCFGRCGGGCGSWSHYTTNIQRNYQYSFDIENGGWCNVYNSTADMVHRTCGCKTHGCAAHDYCVRTWCPGDPGCAFCWPEAVWAGVTGISCLFMGDTCWSYADPVSFDNDVQCFYCNECGCAEGSPPQCPWVP